jgi:hypothetical protein
MYQRPSSMSNTVKEMRDIGSPNGIDEDSSIVGCDAVQIGST